MICFPKSPPPRSAALSTPREMMKHLGNAGVAASAGPAPGPPLLGAMAKRPAALHRGRGELLAVLDRYLDGNISTSDKRSRVVEERDLLCVMEDITR